LNIRRICTTVIFVVSTLVSFASHIPGGNVSYECVGPNQFLVTLTIYEDCASAFISSANQTISVANDCGITGITSASLTNVVYQNQFSPLCPSAVSSSTCNGGTLPGMYEHIWQGVVTLPADCDAWHFAYSSCCRNTSVNLTNGGSESFYWEATINSTTAPCNNSSSSADQIRYLCQNQLNTIEMLPFDADADSLHLTLIDAPTTGPGTSVAYNPTYSGVSPIAGISIDNNTGVIEVTPMLIGNFVVNVLIEEFNGAGDLTGTRIIDMQFYVVNCFTNTAPQYSGLSNIFNATAIDSVTLSSCSGNSMCFDIDCIDLNAFDSVYLQPDLSSFPGATFVQNDFSSSPSGTICWNVPSGSTGTFYIPMDYSDNACPINGTGSTGITIQIAPSLHLGPDINVCDAIPFAISGYSDSTYWEAISGSALVVGSNISCNPCSDPIFTLTDTTVIAASDNTPGLCGSMDTATVFVVESFSATIAPSDDSVCLFQNSSLDVTTSPTGSYTYDWVNSGNLDSYTSSYPVFSASGSGSYIETVTITSAGGCSLSFSTTIEVGNGISPANTIVPSHTNYVCGAMINLEGIGSVFDHSDDFDSGTTSTTLWNSIENGFVNDLCGSSSGTLALHFDGNSGNRRAETVPINLLGCTEINYCLFIGNNSSGGAPCENADNGEDVILEYSIDGGATYAQIQLHDQSDWDSIPNWQCFTITIPAPAQTASTIIRWNQPNYSACTGCDNWSLDDVAFTCPQNYLYSWSPSSGMTSPNSSSTDLFVPTDSTTYFLYTLDTVSGCDFTSQFTIVPECDSCQTPIPTYTDSLGCYGDADGSIHINVLGSDGPFTIVLYDSFGSVVDSVTGIETDTAFSGLSAGNYLVTSTGSASCSTDTAFTIEQPLDFTAIASADTSFCGEGIFYLLGNSAGGTGAASYFWSTGDMGAGPHVDTALTSTIIILTAMDDNGCADKDSMIVTIYELPVVTTDSLPNDTVCNNSGFLILPAGNPSGGVFSGPGVTGNVFDPLVAGAADHMVYYTYTDSNGCSAADTIEIHVLNCTGIKEQFENTSTIYPNPFGEYIEVSSLSKISEIKLFDLSGKLVLSQIGSSTLYSVPCQNVLPGSYIIEIVTNGLPTRTKVIKFK